MSVGPAFVARYNDDDDAAIVALRDAVGVNRMWVDAAGEGATPPYLVVRTIDGVLMAEDKAGTTLQDHNIQVNVHAASDVDTIQDLLFLAYHRKPLTVANAIHKTTMYDRRRNEALGKNEFNGVMQFIVTTEM